MGAVPLVDYLFKVGPAFARSRAALYGPLDVIHRHVLRACSLHGEPQAEVRVGVASALAGRHGNFACQFSEELPAPGVGGTLLTLNRGPFAMTGHFVTLWY